MVDRVRFSGFILLLAFGCGRGPTDSKPGEYTSQPRLQPTGQPTPAANATSPTPTPSPAPSTPVPAPAPGTEPPSPTPTDPPAIAPLPSHRARYPEGVTQSPLSPSVVERLKAIAAKQERDAASLMKVGDSITVSPHNLTCFDGSNVDLGAASDLQATLTAFASRTPDPFTRDSLAAEDGWSANGPLQGSPTLLEQEIVAMNARFAAVMFGTNDVETNAPFTFAERMWTIISKLTDAGVVPILSSIPSRSNASNARVPMYNRIVKALAEAHQVPFVDLHRELETLPDQGLTGDGVHLNVYAPGGIGRGCLLTPEGLAYGHNVKNLLTLRALDRARSVLVEDAPGSDDPGPAPQGAGSTADPFVIDALPYVHAADSNSGTRSIASYSCDYTKNEAGPELYYRFETTTQVTVRAMVLTPSPDVDVDLHLLDTAPENDRCVSRAHQTLTETLDPGTYWFVLDTYVSSTSGEKPGDYIFILEPQ